MANAIYSIRTFRPQKSGANTIALLIDRDKEYSQAEIDMVCEYANIVGYQFEILKPIGRMQPGWDEDDSPKLWDEYEKDDRFDEVGVLYEDMISGKVYAMSSDYYTSMPGGVSMMIYSHFLEEMKAIDPKDLYDQNRPLRSGEIKFQDIEYLQIYRS